jgi:hypothetical protein
MGVKESAEVVVLKADTQKGRTELVKSKDLDEELVEVGVGVSDRGLKRHYLPRSIWRKRNEIWKTRGPTNGCREPTSENFDNGAHGKGL